MTVHDGTTERAQVIAELCRSGPGAEVTSSGPYLHLASHVASHVDSQVASHAASHVAGNVTGHVNHTNISAVRRHRRARAGFQLSYRFEKDPVKQGLTPDLIREYVEGL